MRVIHSRFEPGDPGHAEPVCAMARRAPLVAAFNLSPRPGDVEGNLLLAEETLVEAKRAHPALRWAVLPELFTCAYSDLASVRRHAEDARRGPSARFFAALARRLGLYIAYGFPEKRRGNPGGVSDSANLVGPGDSGVLLTYRKRRLVRTNGEDRLFVPGGKVPIVKAGGTRVALAVCWDLGFPEVVRGAALEGVDLMLAPAGWRDPWGAQYGLSCAARALDNAVYVASANQLGTYPEAAFGEPGGVWGPDGIRLSGGVGLGGVGELDHALPTRWRALYGSTVPEHGNPPGTVPLEACS